MAGGSDPIPWQTDTCIGDWHYRRSLFDQHRYKTPIQVVQMLIDIVSKNGNLMLNIPLPGNGLPDDDEMKVLDALATWIAPNGEAIYGTRPWAVYGEGPSTTGGGRRGMGSDVRSYTAEDVRFTKKGDIVYAFLMGWPADGKATSRAWPSVRELPEGNRESGTSRRRQRCLHARRFGTRGHLPEQKPNDYAYALKIMPAYLHIS